MGSYIHLLKVTSRKHIKQVVSTILNINLNNKFISFNSFPSLQAHMVPDYAPMYWMNVDEDQNGPMPFLKGDETKDASVDKDSMACQAR